MCTIFHASRFCWINVSHSILSLLSSYKSIIQFNFGCKKTTIISYEFSSNYLSHGVQDKYVLAIFNNNNNSLIVKLLMSILYLNLNKILKVERSMAFKINKKKKYDAMQDNSFHLLITPALLNLRRY